VNRAHKSSAGRRDKRVGECVWPSQLLLLLFFLFQSPSGTALASAFLTRSGLPPRAAYSAFPSPLLLISWPLVARACRNTNGTSLRQVDGKGKRDGFLYLVSCCVPSFPCGSLASFRKNGHGSSVVRNLLLSSFPRTYHYQLRRALVPEEK
jgi:hypothetical protein